MDCRRPTPKPNGWRLALCVLIKEIDDKTSGARFRPLSNASFAHLVAVPRGSIVTPRKAIADIVGLPSHKHFVRAPKDNDVIEVFNLGRKFEQLRTTGAPHSFRLYPSARAALIVGL